ncbi:MAG TPA: dihydrodipicolinate synthase family protein [Candidatus Hydrogenedentes bacterium]|nr:dihydrodipicolinate synthase family protein [Candidatus Hydrogenedentota bacterium]HPG65214.1 dihydrodipicolinate synthase family protein [Candidatus Hydrogenedentota bacterium]
MKFNLEGVIPALLTPFTKNGDQVDYDSACALAVRLADQGVHGVFTCGTTGEGMLMTVEERKRALEAVVATVGKRIRVIAHTGALDTSTTIELTRHAAEAGAYAAGVVAPGFYAYDDTALFNHFEAIAGAVKGFPVLLYNIPGCARNKIGPELIVRLANQVDNIVGMKDSAGDIAALNRVLGDAPAAFRVINGVDEYSYNALLAGAAGCVSSTANVVPEVFLSIFDNVRKGNLKKAWASQVQLSHLCGVFQYGKMVAYYKEGLRLRGFDPGYVRPPQRELSGRERKAFAQALRDNGLI